MNDVMKFWLAVNGDNETGVISANREGLIRFDPSIKAHMKLCISYNDFKSTTPHWIEYHAKPGKFGESPYFLRVPKAWICKIVGFDMTWADNPVYIDAETIIATQPTTDNQQLKTDE